MTYYSKFDIEIYSDEQIEVSPEEQAEVFKLMAEEYQAQEGFAAWSEETERKAIVEQEAFEQKQASQKDWLSGYSPDDDGETFEGVAI
jgi:hypothetical protein